ncbi:MAG: hypothetical protein ACWGHH_06635 [Sulfurovaceae bacterium]
MPILKTENIMISTKMKGIQHIKVKICVNAQGKFYCNLEPDMKTAVQGVFDVYNYSENKGKLTVKAETLDLLVNNLKRAYTTYMEPAVTKEQVILYNIESHVSFAEDDEGKYYFKQLLESAGANLIELQKLLIDESDLVERYKEVIEKMIKEEKNELR